MRPAQRPIAASPHRSAGGDGPGQVRFQIDLDPQGQYRWHVFNAYGTHVGSSPQGFPTELEARSDADHLKQQIASAPIIGQQTDTD